MQPRYKVIADYPGNEFKVGEILEEAHDGARIISQNTGVYIDWMKVKKYPHLFKPLEWWEDRKPEDMPEFVKLHPKAWEGSAINRDIVLKVERIEVRGDTCLIQTALTGNPLQPFYFLPASLSDYNQQSNSNN